MRPSALQMLLCLVGLQGPETCIAQSTWKNRKLTHLKATERANKFVTNPKDLDYFAKDLQNDRNFVSNLDKILVPRVVGSANHRAVRAHIVNQMKNLGWIVEEDKFTDRTPIGNKEFTNVIATLDPSAPRRLVIACHYDSKIEPAGFLGAIDSAVPCAMMINLAHTLHQDLKTQKAKSPELSLQFLFLDGEEAFQRWTSTDSIYGARNLAAKLETQGFTSGGVNGNHLDRIDMFLLLDLIGTSDTQFVSLEQPTREWYNRLVDIENSLRRSGKVRGNTIFQDVFMNAGIEDDHIPFKRRSVPILHLISAPFPSVWHKITDNRENLDFNRISDISQILRVFTAEYLHLLP